MAKLCPKCRKREPVTYVGNLHVCLECGLRWAREANGLTRIKLLAHLIASVSSESEDAERRAIERLLHELNTEWEETKWLK